MAFDFVGSYELAGRFTERQVERLKAELPVGYSVRDNRGGSWWGGQWRNALLALGIGDPDYLFYLLDALRVATTTTGLS